MTSREKIGDGQEQTHRNATKAGHKTKTSFAKEQSTKETLKDAHEFIGDRKHPCVMAKTVLKNKKITARDYGELGTVKSANRILGDLSGFGKSELGGTNDFRTHLAVFGTTEIEDERHFEDLLWQQLRMISSQDGQDWDESVSSDPHSPDFSLSIGGTAFYLVGMHPRSSRMARRFSSPAIAFNMHKQFELLREWGRFERVRNTIRKRDTKLQGGINPMMLDFGVKSEARQYSGRKTDDNWKCPFH